MPVEPAISAFCDQAASTEIYKSKVKSSKGTLCFIALDSYELFKVLTPWANKHPTSLVHWLFILLCFENYLMYEMTQAAC